MVLGVEPRRGVVLQRDAANLGQEVQVPPELAVGSISLVETGKNGGQRQYKNAKNASGYST